MLCRECNSQVPDGSRFCLSCGISLKDKTDNPFAVSEQPYCDNNPPTANKNALQNNPTTPGDIKAFASENHNSYTVIDRRLEEPLNDAVRNIIASPIKQSICSPPKKNEEQMSQLRRIKEIGDIGATVSAIVFFVTWLPGFDPDVHRLAMDSCWIFLIIKWVARSKEKRGAF